MVDTRRTRRASGRVFRGDSRAARRHPGGLRLGTRGAIGACGRHSGSSRGESRDTWRLGGLLGV